MNRLETLANTVLRHHVKDLAQQAGFIVNDGGYAHYENAMLLFYNMAVQQERNRCVTAAVGAIQGMK